MKFLYDIDKTTTVCYDIAVVSNTIYKFYEVERSDYTGKHNGNAKGCT